MWNWAHASEEVEAHCQESLNELGLEYFDLYLMHFPIAFEKIKVGTEGFNDGGKHAHFDIMSVPQVLIKSTLLKN